MFESKAKHRARRAVADSTTVAGTEKEASKMLLCRACLVLLRTEDVSYDLCSEKGLATKYFACTGGDPDMHIQTKEEEQLVTQQLVLKSICECCYQLVQKFHDFQRMCEESSRNFEKLLAVVNSQDTVHNSIQEQDVTNTTSSILPEYDTLSEGIQCDGEEATPAESIEDIEEVYIIEDESAKKNLGREKIPISSRQNVPGQRKQGLRYTLNCSKCNRGFYKIASLEAHMKKHDGIAPHTCVHCGRSYARANLLESHLREKHLGSTQSITYPCPRCDKVYRASRSLNYHFKREHKSQQKQEPPASMHMCDRCGKSYARKANLARHQWVHRSMDERRHVCQFCGQRFYTKQNMVDHLQRRHTSSKSLLRCKKCGRIFRSRAALAVHRTKKHSSATTGGARQKQDRSLAQIVRE
ncbi:zinc finger protein 771 [Drosophila obscura]|uniref:zinc finger protein 771 n=1 Tax=Drosophila obscura TaxID=7282 RepID=UPI001BB1A5A0|nr:zinc finger protein 771 [Drosophila obscura]